MGRAYNKGRGCPAEMDSHTGGPSSGEVSRGVKKVLLRTEEKERHKDCGGSYGKETAQGDILHVKQKRKLPV
jgi:hypothetical protein